MGFRTCAALAYETDSTEISREATMEEYLELKQFLLRRTQRAAGFVTLYILLVVSGEVCCPVHSVHLMKMGSVHWPDKHMPGQKW